MTYSANFHPSEKLLSQFANGTLPPGLSVALSAHVELCETCHAKSNELESDAAGAWLDAPQDFKSPDFSDMVASITSQPQSAEISDKDIQVTQVDMLGQNVKLPRVLAKAASQGLVWKKLSGGVNQAEVTLDNETKCEFIYMAPGSKVPVHKHKGSEVTLVLDGSFSDELGHYKKSDFMVRTKEHLHQPASEEGCLCFSVLDSPLTFTKGMARLLNPFMEYKFNSELARRSS